MEEIQWIKKNLFACSKFRQHMLRGDNGILYYFIFHFHFNVYCMCFNFQHLLHTGKLLTKVQLNNFSIFTDKMFELLCQLKIVHSSLFKKCKKDDTLLLKRSCQFELCFLYSPVYRDANDNIAWQKEAKDAEKWTDTAKNIASPPWNCNGPNDLKRHHEESHLKKKKIDEISQKTTKLSQMLDVCK